MSQDSSNQRAAEVAEQVGLLWLNDVFRFRDGTMRIWNTRVTGFELVWGILVAVLWGLVGMGLWYLVGHLWLLQILFHPVVVIIQALSIGWFFGRRLAHVSPLRRQTGEGNSVYLKLMMDRVVTRVVAMTGQHATYNSCMSEVGREPQVVECIEWIGTTRALKMPQFDPASGKDYVEVELRPRGQAVPFIERQDGGRR